MILENIKRVLIIRCGALGETIFALPVVEALKQQYGENIEIDWVGTPAASALFKLDQRINRIFHLKHRRFPIIFSKEKRKIIEHSKKHPYDLLINLESGHIFYPLVKKIVATHKLGMPYNQIRGMPNPHVIDSLKTMYESIIDPVIMQNSYPELFGEETSAVEQRFALPKHYIVINASTSHHRKFTHRAWPINHWKELIEYLAPIYNVVIIGGKGEEAFFDSLRPFSSSVIDLVGKSTLPELITIIRNAEIIITADTGPSHIASAVNTRTFALFGPSNSKGTGPYPTPFNNIHIISMNLECSPCNATRRIKSCNDNQCMKQILPSMVANAIKPFITPK
ncbi:MAG: glycosyltransferase family 9 protein [Sulfuricurvum sp.]|nr:glycosyltransferase family 9 protein [Sulfuricurvum sp.]